MKKVSSLNGRAVWVAIATAVLSGACSGAHRMGRGVEPADQGLAGPSVASRFHPLLLPADQRDANVPTRAGIYGDDQEASVVSAVENQVRFENVIQLQGRGLELSGSRIPARREKRPLFMVWPDDALGSPMVSAYVDSVVSSDARNGSQHVFRGLEVSRDAALGRWFVPVKALVGDDLELVDPSVTYKVLLAFGLADGSREKLEVSFRANGNVPSLHPESDPVVLTDSAAPPETGIRSDGWTLKRETYTNPSSRVLNLWFKGHGKATVTGYLDVNRYGVGPMVGSEMSINAWVDTWTSQAELVLDEVRVNREGGHYTSKRVQEGDFGQIRLAPFEKVRLEWRAHASDEVPVCSLPEATVHPFSWTVSLGDCAGTGRHMDDCLTGRVTRTAERTENWVVAGMGIVGQLSRLVVVTDGAAGEPSALDDPNGVRVVISEENAPADPIHSGRGGPVTPDRAFSCQGLF